MKRLRHNPRLVALMIYALLVNLAWFSAASAHHVSVSNAWCSQSSDAVGRVAPISLLGDRHDGCDQLCGSMAVAAFACNDAATDGLVPLAPFPFNDLGAAAAAVVLPWQARAPPLV